MSQVTSWGQYPHYPQTPTSLYWQSDISSELSKVAGLNSSTLPYGLGRSYGDSCLATSDSVLQTAKLDRFLEVDWNTGILRAEAGMTLETVLEYAIPRGWFLPTSPGTKHITLGGAVANDVHGKNHHLVGTFGRHVKKFLLVRSDQSPLVCSPTENVDLFNTTIGGLGLTGIIAWVEFQLVAIKSSNINATSIRFGSLNEFFEISRKYDHIYPYTMAWVDCLATGKSLGRGVYLCGDHATDGPLQVNQKKKKNVFFTPPISGVNKLTLKPFNFLYYHKYKAGQNSFVQNYDPFFYPLDSILHWNRIYGKAGFQQWQCVLPESTAQRAMPEILKLISQSGVGSMLAVLKRCGDLPSPGVLSFPIPGLSLALDFPNQKVLDTLFPVLDSIVREGGGRLYPAKDAHMSANDFKSFYPQWELLENLRDPTLNSRFWKRVTT